MAVKHSLISDTSWTSWEVQDQDASNQVSGDGFKRAIHLPGVSSHVDGREREHTLHRASSPPTSFSKGTESCCQGFTLMP